MKPTLAAWLAGFFDGEGSISAFVTNRKTAWVRLTVSVTQKNPIPIELLQRLFPYGRMFRWKASNGSVICEWACGGQTALAFLRSVRPYLRVKHAQADLAIDFLNQPWRSRGTAQGGRRILRTSEQKRFDVIRAKQITILNSKGNGNARRRAKNFLRGIKFQDAHTYLPPKSAGSGRFLPIRRDGSSSVG